MKKLQCVDVESIFQPCYDYPCSCEKINFRFEMVENLIIGCRSCGRSLVFELWMVNNSYVFKCVDKSRFTSLGNLVNTIVKNTFLTSQVLILKNDAFPNFDNNLFLNNCVSLTTQKCLLITPLKLKYYYIYRFLSQKVWNTDIISIVMKFILN